MPNPTPQFKAHIVFTFEEHASADRWRKFVFDSSGYRRVPMTMDGIPDMHTVGMWIPTEGTFYENDEIDADCVVIWPEGFTNIVKKGVSFKLWDGGFFANGVVTERIDAGWPKIKDNAA